MDYFFQKDTWTRCAKVFLSSRDEIEYEFDSGTTVQISPVGGKSAEVRVDGHSVGAAGDAAHLVEILCENVGQGEEEGDSFLDFMNEIFEPYDNDDDL